MTDVFMSGSTGTLGKIILPNLQKKDFDVIPINLRIPASSQSKPSNLNHSFLLHLASQNSTMRSRDMDKELDLLASALDVAERNKIQHFIFFSTSKLYPATADFNLTQEDSNIFATEPYVIGKNKCESLLENKLDCFKSITILRLAPVLVKSKSSNMNTLFKICELLPIIPMFPTGNKNRRSFLSCINLFNFLTMLLRTDPKGFQVINLCDNQPVSTNALIESFLKRYRPKAIRLPIPFFIELLMLALPVIGKKLQSMFMDNVLANENIKSSFPDFELLDTEKVMEFKGLGDD